MLTAELLLSHFLAPVLPPLAPSGFSLAVGPGHFPSWSLVSLCPFLASGRRVFWVDACNHFDLYGLTRAAQALGAQPKAVLDNLQLIRPFTAFQLEKIAASRLPSDIPSVVSDPLDLFYDPDLLQEDAVRLFDLFLGHLRRSPAPTLVLAVQRTPAAGRESFSWKLRRAADAVAVLGREDGQWKLESLRRRDVLPVREG